MIRAEEYNGYPLAVGSNGYKTVEHRIVMETYLGRELERGEVVHHINHIRCDPRIENLELMTRGEHSSPDLKIDWIDVNSNTPRPKNVVVMVNGKIRHAKFIREFWEYDMCRLPVTGVTHWAPFPFCCDQFDGIKYLNFGSEGEIEGACGREIL
jgi:hypothetical protein